MERVDMWRAKGGKIFATEAEAAKHERETSILDKFRDIYFHGMIESAEHIIDLLVDHRPIILEFYGIEK